MPATARPLSFVVGVAFACTLAGCDDDDPTGHSTGEAASPSATASGSALSSSPLSDQEITAARSAAHNAADTIFDYDWKDYDADLDEATAQMTQTMASEFRKSHDGTRRLVAQRRASQDGTVVATGVVAATPDAVHVLVFTNHAGKQEGSAPTDVQFSTGVTMVEQDGTWLVDHLETSTPTVQHDPDPERAKAIDAAADFATAFCNVSAARFDDDTQAVIDLATGQFLEDYQKSLPEVKKLTRANKTVMTGKVFAAGIDKFEIFEAEVIVAVTGSVRSESTKGRRTARNLRLRVTLARVDGAWLASEVEFVS